MRFFSTVLLGILGAGILLTGGASGARADSGEASVSSAASAAATLAVPPQPGTDAEVRNYARREAESPAVGEFAGGDVVVGVSLGLILVVILIVVLLNH